MVISILKKKTLLLNHGGPEMRDRPRKRKQRATFSGFGSLSLQPFGQGEVQQVDVNCRPYLTRMAYNIIENGVVRYPRDVTAYMLIRKGISQLCFLVYTLIKIGPFLDYSMRGNH